MADDRTTPDPDGSAPDPSEDAVRAALRADVPVDSATKSAHIAAAMSAHEEISPSESAPGPDDAGHDAGVVPIRRRWQTIGTVAAALVLVAGVGGVVLLSGTQNESSNDQAATALNDAPASSSEVEAGEFDFEASEDDLYLGTFADVAELESSLGLTPADSDGSVTDRAAEESAPLSADADTGGDAGSTSGTDDLAQSAPTCPLPPGGTVVFAGLAVVGGEPTEVFVVTASDGSSAVVVVETTTCLVRR